MKTKEKPKAAAGGSAELELNDSHTPGPVFPDVMSIKWSKGEKAKLRRLLTAEELEGDKIPQGISRRVKRILFAVLESRP